MSDLNTIKKPRRKFKEKVYAVNMKPPYLKDGETTDGDVPYISFVTAQSNGRRIPCTRKVFKRVEGRKRPGAPHPGLDMRNDLEFVIGVNQEGVVNSVDTFPKTKKLMHNVGRVDEDNPEYVQLTVDGDGQVDVKKVPEHVTYKGVIKLIQLLDGVDEVKPGMLLGGKHEVMSVAGNRVEVDFVAAVVDDG